MVDSKILGKYKESSNVCDQYYVEEMCVGSNSVIARALCFVIAQRAQILYYKAKISLQFGSLVYVKLKQKEPSLCQTRKRDVLLCLLVLSDSNIQI